MKPICKMYKRGGCLGMLAALLLAQSCSWLDGDRNDSSDSPTGELSLKFKESNLTVTTAKAQSESGAKLDTNSFILSIKDQSGKSIYEGLYGNSPETMTLTAGTYAVKVVSEDFTVPKFDAPQWGDEQYIIVESGKKTCLELICSQINSGIRLNISSSFLEDYPLAALLLKDKKGSLVYGYNEKRTAYFSPGTVQLVLSEDGRDEVLMERALESREILQLQINTASGQGEKSGKLSIQVDTSRNYSSEVYVLGGEEQTSSQGEKGSDIQNAYTVAGAKAAIGAKDVWIGAYIVGGDLSAKSVSFQPPFTSASNLAISSRSSTDSKEKCIAVQLPSGKVRDALNLVAHPELLGKYVYLHGDIEASYFGIVGLKNTDDYSLN